jgi:hypothetical protein
MTGPEDTFSMNHGGDNVTSHAQRSMSTPIEYVDQTLTAYWLKFTNRFLQ